MERRTFLRMIAHFQLGTIGINCQKIKSLGSFNEPAALQNPRRLETISAYSQQKKAEQLHFC